jgi:hypothetical protein
MRISAYECYGQRRGHSLEARIRVWSMTRKSGYRFFEKIML